MATAIPKKDVIWDLSNTEYKVLNVPYSVFQDEEYFDLDVSVKLTMIKDLMVLKEIPPIVDFENVVNFDINY